jgi:hypothetical protein
MIDQEEADALVLTEAKTVWRIWSPSHVVEVVARFGWHQGLRRPPHVQAGTLSKVCVLLPRPCRWLPESGVVVRHLGFQPRRGSCETGRGARHRGAWWSPGVVPR